MINELALKCNDAHWYLDKNLFLSKFRHNDLIQSIKKETQYKAQDGSVQDKKRERFIRHYYEKYQTPELPAVWMVAEILSLVMGSSPERVEFLLKRKVSSINIKHLFN